MTQNNESVEAVALEITQADRKAAWTYAPACYEKTDYNAWMTGLYDNSAPVIRDFARHRLAATPREPSSNEVERAHQLVEYLCTALDMISFQAKQLGLSPVVQIIRQTARQKCDFARRKLAALCPESDPPSSNAHTDLIAALSEIADVEFREGLKDAGSRFREKTCRQAADALQALHVTASEREVRFAEAAQHMVDAWKDGDQDRLEGAEANLRAALAGLPLQYETIAQERARTALTEDKGE